MGRAMSREIRQYAASAFFVVLLVLLIGYLTFIPVPDENKEIILTIIGVIVGGAAPAMSRLFGDDDTEKAKLKSEVAELKAENEKLQTEVETLRHQLEYITKELLEKHVITPDDKPRGK